MQKPTLICPACGTTQYGVRPKLRWRLHRVTRCSACGYGMRREGNLIVAAIMTPAMFVVGLAFLFGGMLAAVAVLVGAIAVTELVILRFSQPKMR